MNSALVLAADGMAPAAAAPAPRPTLGHCLLLAALLHLWLVALVGTTPGGPARPAEGVWGSIQIRLGGVGPADSQGRSTTPLPDSGPPGRAPEPRFGGTVREAVPRPSPEPGAAELGAWKPRPSRGPQGRQEAPAQPQTDPAARASLPPVLSHAEPRAPDRRQPQPAPAAAAPPVPQPPPQPVPDATPGPSTAPRLAPVDTVEAPVLERPEQTRREIANPSPTPSVAPRPQPAPLPQRQQPSPLPAAPVAMPPAPPAPLPEPPRPVAAPALTMPLPSLPPTAVRLPPPLVPVAPPTPAAVDPTLPPLPEPEPARAVQVAPAPVPLPPLEPTPIVPPAAPGPAPAPVETRPLPAAPLPEPTLQPIDVSTLPPLAPPAIAPPPVRTVVPAVAAPPPRASPAATAGGQPTAGPRAGADRATAPSASASAPPLNLELPAARAAVQGVTAPRLLNLVPPPPLRRSTLSEGIEKAAKPDCRKAYSGMGVLAVVPLAADALRDGGCRW